MENSYTKVKIMQSILVAFIIEVENIASKNTHVLKNSAEIGQCFVLISQDVISAKSHIKQMMKNSV